MVCDQCGLIIQDRTDRSQPKFCNRCGNNLVWQEQGLSIRGEQKPDTHQVFEAKIAKTRVCSIPLEVVEKLGLKGRAGRVKFLLAGKNISIVPVEQ